MSSEYNTLRYKVSGGTAILELLDLSHFSSGGALSRFFRPPLRLLSPYYVDTKWLLLEKFLITRPERVPYTSIRFTVFQRVGSHLVEGGATYTG